MLPIFFLMVYPQLKIAFLIDSNDKYSKIVIRFVVYNFFFVGHHHFGMSRLTSPSDKKSLLQIVQNCFIYLALTKKEVNLFVINSVFVEEKQTRGVHPRLIIKLLHGNKKRIY